MQPTYLPWLGYFDLIDQSDVFVFLDSVQFAKRSWQQRNQILTHEGLDWLTIPAKVKGKYHQLISEVEVSFDDGFPSNHIKAIEFNYRRAPYFDRYFENIAEIISSSDPKLTVINISLIKYLSQALGISTEFVSSTDLMGEGKRSDLLIDLILKVNAKKYLSPPGSLEYLLSDKKLFDSVNVEVDIQMYEHPVYRQLYEPFVPYASIIDLLFNCGESALEILRSGRRAPKNLQQFMMETSSAKD